MSVCWACPFWQRDSAPSRSVSSRGHWIGLMQPLSGQPGVPGGWGSNVSRTWFNSHWRWTLSLFTQGLVKKNVSACDQRRWKCPFLWQQLSVFTGIQGLVCPQASRRFCQGQFGWSFSMITQRGLSSHLTFKELYLWRTRLIKKLKGCF